MAIRVLSNPEVEDMNLDRLDMVIRGEVDGNNRCLMSCDDDDDDEVGCLRGEESNMMVMSE
jgi:hypothetical protein